MTLELRPITLSQARRFVATHHRHNEPTRGWLFGTGLFDGVELRAVGVAGRPVARALQDGRTVEITTVCTIGDRNAASRVYGALCRAAKALGYGRAITYTLASEAGSSTSAAGFRRDGDVSARRHSHTTGSGAGLRAGDRLQLFDVPRLADGPKVRWVRDP